MPVAARGRASARGASPFAAREALRSSRARAADGQEGGGDPLRVGLFDGAADPSGGAVDHRLAVLFLVREILVPRDRSDARAIGRTLTIGADQQGLDAELAEAESLVGIEG